MKKIISWALKIIPIITIWQGITSGGARLKPFVDTVKVALTQYEVAQITKLVADDFGGSNGKVIAAAKFPAFIQDNFHNQYSVLAREIKGDQSHDHSKDIWGKEFQLIVNADITNIKVASAGPDGIINNKDDIAADFSIEREIVRRPASVPALAPVENVSADLAVAEEAVDQAPESEVVLDQPEPHDEQLAAAAPEEEPLLDAEGFDNQGYDRDGYDREGIHRSEKEAPISQ